jgi:hypothetical protein
MVFEAMVSLDTGDVEGSSVRRWAAKCRGEEELQRRKTEERRQR